MSPWKSVDHITLLLKSSNLLPHQSFSTISKLLEWMTQTSLTSTLVIPLPSPIYPGRLFVPPDSSLLQGLWKCHCPLTQKDFKFLLYSVKSPICLPILSPGSHALNFLTPPPPPPAPSWLQALPTNSCYSPGAHSMMSVFLPHLGCSWHKSRYSSDLVKSIDGQTMGQRGKKRKAEEMAM